MRSTFLKKIAFSAKLMYDGTHKMQGKRRDTL